jgi:hypothetical protein
MSRGRFYLRCESDEWDFIRDLQAPPPFDAAVISDRYLADYPEGHKRFGEPRDGLAKELDGRGIRWSVDPDTARLEQAKSAERQRPRAANRPLAKAVPLPLSAGRLADPNAVDELVEACSLHQLGSRAFAAPYLEVTGPDDPRWNINKKLLARSQELAGDRILIAYLQVLRSHLLDGNAAVLARRLAEAGANVIFVRVRRFEAESATTEEVLAYGDVIDAGTTNGSRVVADCVGRLGPTLIAAGADGFATNAWRFRKVSDDLHPAGGGGGGAGELLWEVPDFALGLPQGAGNSSRSCAIGNCPAPQGPNGDHLATRIHNLHEFHRAARLAAREEFDYAKRLSKSHSLVARRWGIALQQLEKRRAASTATHSPRV